VFDNVESIVGGLGVEVASDQTDIAGATGQFDELGGVEGLHHPVRQVLVVLPVVLCVQLQLFKLAFLNLNLILEFTWAV